MIDPVVEARYEQIRSQFQMLQNHPDLEHPIVKWVEEDDSHLPQRVIGDTVRELLDPARWSEICRMSGVGIGKLSKLLDLLERAEAALRNDPNRMPLVHAFTPLQATVPHPASDEEATNALMWGPWGELFRHHRLETYPLGRFARSLLEVPQGLWTSLLGFYTSKTYVQLHSIPGQGPARTRQIVRVITDIAKSLPRTTDCDHLLCRLLPERLHAIACWIDEMLGARTVPNPHDLRLHLLEPLLEQFALDLGADDSDMIRRRWGLDAPARTLEELAQELDLTRERVRQITARAADVMRVRWPEGRRALDDFYELLLTSPDAGEQLAFCRTVLDSCYEVRVSRGGTLDDVLAAWDRAGRQKLTPLTDAELETWVSSEFPQHDPATIRSWLAREGLRLERDGGTLSFSREPLDLLLKSILATQLPIPLAEAAARIECDERSLRGRIDRDCRFIEDEEKCIHACDSYGIFRESGVWRIRLAPAETRRIESVSIPELARLIVGGLLERGVADATVWGVRRYADVQLKRTCGSVLPENLTPFIFADLLVRHTDGGICTMRRRRLRWDTADDSLPVRGKRGWIEHLIATAAQPVTLEELRAALRGAYQDYEDYVTNQLSFDDEDGEARELTFHTTAGNASRIPKFFVANDWSLDTAMSNVSEGTRRFAERIVAAAASGDRAYSRSELQHLPWVVALCERLAGGAMRWAE